MPSRMPNEGFLEILPLSDPGFLAHRRHPEWPASDWSTPGERPILLVLHCTTYLGCVGLVRIPCAIGTSCLSWCGFPVVVNGTSLFLALSLHGRMLFAPCFIECYFRFVAAHSLPVEYGSSTGSWMLMFSSSIWVLPRVSNPVLLSHNFILVLSSVVNKFPGVFFVSTHKNASLLQPIVLSGF